MLPLSVSFGGVAEEQVASAPGPMTFAIKLEWLATEPHHYNLQYLHCMVQIVVQGQANNYGASYSTHSC